MMQRFCFSVAVMMAVVGTVHAGNWAHWRGPTGNGTAPDANPPTEWSATKNVKWKVEIPGRGSGSPVIWEDKVFVVTAVPAEGAAGNPPRRRSRRGNLPKLQFQLLCFNRANGDLVWKRTAVEATPHEGTHSTNGYASASPCTDGKMVYAHFGSRGLYCYDFSGDLKWKRTDLGKMQTRAGFGEGSSPTIAGKKLLVPWDHEGQSFLYCLDKTTGDTIWKTPRAEPTCWATPLVVEAADQTLVVLNGQVSARAYDLESGEEVWRCAGQTQRPAASPVAADGLVFVGSGFRGSFLGAFKLTGTGNIEGTKFVAWTVGRDTPDIASPLLSGGRLYFHKGKSGLLSCFDAKTGKPHYTASRLPLANIYASPVAAGGHVYLSDRNGTTVVIKDAEQLEIIAENSVGETIDATPAPVDDELFIRGERHLFCIAE